MGVEGYRFATDSVRTPELDDDKRSTAGCFAVLVIFYLQFSGRLRLLSESQSHVRFRKIMSRSVFG